MKKCRLEILLEKIAQFVLVQNSAISFSLLLAVYKGVLWHSGCLNTILRGTSPDDHRSAEATLAADAMPLDTARTSLDDHRTAEATVALALTGIAALVGASLASYEIQRSTKHARRAAQATFLLELEGRFMSPELREAQDALRQIWTEADKYFKRVSTDHAERRRMHDPISKQALENWLRDPGDDHKTEFLSHHIAHQLNHLRTTNEHIYHVLLRNCEIFETIGVMHKHAYIDSKDVNERFKYALDRVDVSFRHNLRDDAIFDGDKPFANAMDLAKRLKEIILLLNASAGGRQIVS